MPLSNAQILDEYLAARDALVAAIAAGENVVELEIRGRRVRYSDPVAALKLVEERLAHYQRLVAAGPARNYFRLRR